MIEIQEEWFTPQQCRDNPHKLYVFGDNIMRVGTKGQAQIRYCSNSIGIATKRLPSMKEDAFFSDTKTDLKHMIKDLNELFLQKERYEVIVFPKDGLGTGLSKMPEKSPKIFGILCLILNASYGVVMDKNGFKKTVSTPRI